jgi:hypothetical protein
MIDVSTETVLSLPDAAKRLPKRRAGVVPHVATLYRWAQKGCKGIRLETIQIGGTSCTSTEALQRFFDRLTAARSGETVPVRTSRQRQRAQEEANAELERAGW